MSENVHVTKKTPDNLGGVIFDALSSHIAILDGNGLVLKVNKAWQNFRKLHPPAPHCLGEGENFLRACQNITPENHRESFERGFQAIKNGRLVEFSFELSSLVAGHKRWFQCQMTPLKIHGETNIMLSHEDITALKESQREIEQLAYFDSLTGLPNRLLFIDRINQALARAERDGKKVAVLFLDLDRFKLINDSLGHAAGDQFLQTIAQRIKSAVRAMDTVARFGGDEFVLLLPNLEHSDDAAFIAKKLLRIVSTPIRLGDQDLFPSCSIGIAIFPDDARGPESLITFSDMAMYHAKDIGRNNYQFFSEELNARLKTRLRLETDLRRAFQGGEFELYYQPSYELESHRWLAVKALLRWNHPVHGLLPARGFVPLAEEIGLIVPLWEWALRKACLQVLDWQQLGWPDLLLSHSLNHRQMFHPGVVETINAILQETRFDPSHLEFEINENTFLKNRKEISPLSLALKKIGVKITINNFGFPFSLLRLIKHLGFNRINIDPSFISNAPNNPQYEAITEAIIKTGKSLHIKVLAKGVENKKQFDFLRLQQCDEVQGFFFTPPVSPDKLLEQIRTHFPDWEALPGDDPATFKE